MSSRQSWLKNRSLFVTPPSPKVKKKRLFRHILLTAFKRLLMVFGLMFFLSFFSASIFIGYFLPESAPVPALPEEFVLSITIQPEYIEHHNVAGFGLVPQPLTFQQMIDRLEKAQKDGRVKALYARLSGTPSNLAQLQDLRESISAFGKAGKKTFIYAPSFAEGTGLRGYYLASAFDEIWMQPVGAVALSGLGVEVPFVRQTLEKIGVAPQFFARKGYKNVMESLVRDEMSDASREMYESLLADLSGQIQAGITQSGKIEELGALIAQGLFTDKEALSAGLVSGLAAEPTVREVVRGMVKGGAAKKDEEVFFDLALYRPRKTEGGAQDMRGLSAEHKGAALIYVTGAIMSRAQQGGRDGLYAADKPAAEDIAAAILEAVENEQINTIVLRVDSPGGSPTASETIRQALVRAKDQGMKVIVSMGGMAASGGYWISAPADVIFAAPGTYTGSIGVAGGKIYDDGLWQRLGVNWERVEAAEHASMYSFNRPFTEQEEELMNRQMDRIYEAFLERVAEGRNMTLETVEEIAQGRVWTGQQALDRGLVDRLGGLGDALDYAAEQAGYKDRFEMPVTVLPRPASPFEVFLDLFDHQSMVAVAADMERVLAVFRGVLSGAAAMTSSPVTTYEPARLE